jgi:protein-arginine deiminase
VFATATAPDSARTNIIIDSIRDRGLDNFAEDYFSDPGWYVGVWGNSINATTFDSFGNLDASPPVDGYPFGRIYYGLEGPDGLDSVLAGFLAEQTIQEPFPVDTAWLCVGHVDEFSSFVPDPSSPKGFKMLLSDTTAAYELFEGLDPSWQLGRFEDAYGYATVGDLLADQALRSLNEDLQANELDPLRARFKAELGLTDDDIIDIPTLFERLDFCGNYVVALTPGTVNLIVANLDGQTPVLAVPDPFARAESLGPEDDPLAQDFVNRMPDGLEVVFIDDWYSYHLLDGEVHCGTNVTRTPLADWTTDGAALLGLEGGN